MGKVTYRDPVLRLRQRLATSITQWYELSDMTAADAAKKLGLHAPDFSRLYRGDLTKLSAERLLRSWVAIGGDWDLLLTMTGEFQWPPPE